MAEIPKKFTDFTKAFPDIAKAYEQLGDAVHQSGPIDQKTRELIKLGISAGAQKEGAVHSHTRKARDAGASEEEIRQAVILTLPTLGMPSMMAALSWVDDVLEKK